MSVYNGEIYLAEAIESILQQTYQEFEFIIINDGSTDTSWQIIQQFSEKNLRIVSITQENIGLTRSLNKGIQLAKGEYIARMDADDVSLPHRFETQLPWLVEKDYDMCCSRTWLINENRVSPRLKYYLPKKWLLKFGNPFIHGTYLMRKSILDEVGGYDESFRYAQDYKLIYDIFEKGYRVKYIKEPLYRTRKPEGSISVKCREKQLQYGRQLRSVYTNQ